MLAQRQQPEQLGLAKLRTGERYLAQVGSPAGLQCAQRAQPHLRMRQLSLLTHGVMCAGLCNDMAPCLEAHSRDEVFGLQVPIAFLYRRRSLHIMRQCCRTTSAIACPLPAQTLYNIQQNPGGELQRACRQYHRLTVSRNGMRCSAPPMAASLTLRLLSPLSDSSVRRVKAAIAASAASLSLLRASARR